MREFWVASGHHLSRVTPEGRLAVTDELLLAWLARPEIVPPEDACAAERALHARLLAAPKAHVAPGEIAVLADRDARENWEHFLGFRDRLIAAGTIEGAYLGLIREGAQVAPIFLEQLVHLVMRNALDGVDDPFTLRAAELFWRPQRGFVREGGLVLVDEERIAALESEARASPLMAMLGPAPEEGFEVMTPDLLEPIGRACDGAAGRGRAAGAGGARAGHCCLPAPSPRTRDIRGAAGCRG